MDVENLLLQIKDRLKISHRSEDQTLTRMIKQSISYINVMCGKYDDEGNIDLNNRLEELVLERTRYTYNEALEYFEDNYLSEIFSLGIEMAGGNDET